jgi:RHS repeat-associated protein
MHVRDMRSLLNRLQRPTTMLLFALVFTLSTFTAFAQKAYIPNNGDGTVSVINATTGALCTTTTSGCVSTATYPIPVGTNPQAAAVSPDGKKAYIANTGSGSVSVIDTSTDAVIATVSVSTPSALVVLPNNSSVYVLGLGGTMSVIRVSDDTVTATFSVPLGFGTAIAATSDSSTVYVDSSNIACGSGDGVGERYLWAINTSDNSETSTFLSYACGDGASHLAVSPDNTTLYASSGAGLEIISPSSGILSTIVPASGYGAYNVALSADGSTVYVTSHNSVYQIKGSTVANSATIGTTPSGLSITPNGNALFVTNAVTSGTVSELSTIDLTSLGTVSVGTSPYAYGLFMQPPVPMPGKDLGPKTDNCDAANAAGTLTCDGSVSAGEPIDVGSGNVSYKVTDYTTAGANPLAFTRYYNSRADAGNLSTFAYEFYPNWRSNFDRFIQILSSSQVTVERPTGQQLNFTLSGSTWTPDTDVDVTLTKSGTTWTLTDKDDTVETYTTISAYEGQLNSIKSRDGYTQTLTYTSGQLTSVTDSYSRTLSLTYNTNGTLNTVSTPDSTTLTYGYNPLSSGNQLISVTYPTSPATSQTYGYAYPDRIFALTSITDENGNVFDSWTYDVYGRGLTSQQGSGANLTTLGYNSNGTTSVTNPLGVTDTYSFSTLQGVPKITGISRASTSTTAAASETITYDSNGYLASLTDWNGDQTTHTNNSHGLPTTINEAVGSTVARTTTVSYDSTWVRLPASITTPGLTTSFTYDSNGNALTKTLTDTTTTTVPYSTGGQTRVWTYTYDSTGHVQSIKTPNSHTTTYAYDSTGALTSVTNALSQATTISSHTGGGLPETIVDPNSVTTTLSYSPRQWLTSSVISGTGGTFTTSYTYDAAGNLTKTTLPDSSYLSSTYDTAHRVTKITDALGNYINYTLDALGDITQANTYNSTPTLTRQHSATFDALGRQLTDIGGAGQTTTYTYDADGNALTVEDGLSNTTTRVFDALNRLSTSTDANSGVAQYAYNTHDSLTSVTDPISNVTSWVRDGFQEAIQQASPDSGTTVYHFDSDGNLTQRVDAASNTMNQTFDALDRTLTTTYPADSTLAVAYTYDQTTGHGFGIGRLTSLTDASGSLSKSYDERANLLSEVRTISGTGHTTTYTYDSASRVASIAYPSGTLASYTRDGMGRVTAVASKAPGASSATTLVSSMTYVPFGPMTHMGAFNGVSTTYTLDLDYRITGINDISNTTYTLDNANNVTAISDSVNAAWNETLGYDVLNRLTSDDTYYGYGSLAYTYDKNGNFTTATGGSVTKTFTTTTGTNQIASQSWTDPTWGPITQAVSYTPTGNISNIEVSGVYSNYSATYSAANRLASVSNVPTAFTANYDAFGKRIIKTASGSPIYYSYGQDSRLLEELNSSLYTDYIYVNGRPIGLQSNDSGSSALYYVSTERLGTPRTVTDSTATSQWSGYFLPFGQEDGIGGGVVQNLRYPGQYGDLDGNGWIYNLNREYYSYWGRYNEPDPIGLLGGLNPYRYANDSPRVYSDISGLNSNDNGPGVVVSTGYCWGIFCAGANITNPLSSSPNVYPTLNLGYPPGAYNNAVAASNAHNYATGFSVTIAPPGIDAFGCAAGACAGGFQASVKPSLCIGYGFTNWPTPDEGAPKAIPSATPQIWQRNWFGNTGLAIPVI